MAQAFLLKMTVGRGPGTVGEKVGRQRRFGNSHRLLIDEIGQPIRNYRQIMFEIDV